LYHYYHRCCYRRHKLTVAVGMTVVEWLKLHLGLLILSDVLLRHNKRFVVVVHANQDFFL
jgi:hypothetical protein